MIFSYGVTQQGAYHVKNDTVCQDAHCFRMISEQYSIGAVADGLGSEKYTDVASRIAVDTSVEYCEDKIDEDSTEEYIIETIKKSFRCALNRINEVANSEGHSMDEYDTTLALAVYIRGNIYWGNSGDSGIIVLNSDGTYEPLTVQQRDENGCVYPLFFGEEKWEFGIQKNVSSVLLATDGMYETFFPYLLKNEEVSIYVSLAQFMMDATILGFYNSSSESVQKKMDDFIASIPGNQVSDDKTVLVMLNTDIQSEKQPDEYYYSPDWDVLKKKRDEEYRKAAYPHLFTDN